MRFYHPGTSQLSGKVKLILLGFPTTPISRNVSTFRKTEGNTVLLDFPTTYFPEQGFCQVRHTRNNYRNRLEMSKIGETPFKVTNLQPALRKLADKHHRKVRISWNQLFFRKLITFILQTHLHSFCFVLTRSPVYISLALNYFQNKILFSEKL